MQAKLLSVSSLILIQALASYLMITISPAFSIFLIILGISIALGDKKHKVLLILITNFTLFASFFSWFISMYGIGTHLASSFIFSLIYLTPFFSLTHPRRSTNNTSLNWISFICLWIICEFALLHTDFLPPFFILGNLLYFYTPLIQFYEYTGVLGGSLLSLLICYSLYLVIFKYKFSHLLATTLLLLAPFIFNQINRVRKDNFTSTLKVFALHLNNQDNTLNSFNELKSLFKQIKINDSSLVALPETAFSNHVDVNSPTSNLNLFFLKSQIKSPSASIITGAIAYENSKNNSIRYDAGIAMTKGENQLVYKEKLVPYDENYPLLLRKIKNKEKHYESKPNSTHYYSNNGLTIGIAICYEILYSGFVAERIDNNASCITLLTKESEIESLDIKRKYLYQAQIRAVELRKYIIKSSIKGYTAIIAPTGELIKVLEPSSPTQFIYCDIPIQNLNSFYSVHKNIIPFACITLLIINIVYTYIKLHKIRQL